MQKIFLILSCLIGPVLSCQAIITEQLEAKKDEIQAIRNDSQALNSKCGSCRGCKSKCKSQECSRW